MSMAGETRTWHVPGIERWPQRGGVACLDFANTIAYRPTGNPYEGLCDYQDLLAWSRMAGVISAAEADRLAEAAALDGPGATAALDSARSLRENIFDLFQALSAGQPADPGILASIAARRLDGMTHATLSMAADGFVLAIAPDACNLTRPLWTIAESVTQLLLSGDWRRVHLCPGDDCGWLFLDQTKNGNRRWCDSADCGNRARGRAYTRRRRQRHESDSMEPAPTLANEPEARGD